MPRGFNLSGATDPSQNLTDSADDSPIVSLIADPLNTIRSNI
jgi:hypothetical protein